MSIVQDGTEESINECHMKKNTEISVVDKNPYTNGYKSHLKDSTKEFTQNGISCKNHILLKNP